MGDGQADGAPTGRGWRGRWSRHRGQTASGDALPELPSALSASGVWLLSDAPAAPITTEGAPPGPAPLVGLDSSPRLPAVTAASAEHAASADMTAAEAVPTPAYASGSAVVRGTLSLILREGILRVVVLVANVILARILLPQVFGIFVVLGFFNTFLTTFGAFGLGPALVQRREEPTRDELAAIFTFQVGVAACLALIAVLLAPVLVSIYHLDAPKYGLGGSAAWLIRVMALAFLLISSAATPLSLLERHLSFGRVALIEMASGLTYQTVAVVLAFHGAGVWSLVVATLSSALVWFCTTYLLAHWVPRFSWRVRSIFPLVRFGLRYQVNTFLSLFKDNFVATFVAALLGPIAVGYINWAMTVALYPLIIIQLIQRVTFPAFSRAIHDRARLQHMLEATIRYQCYVSFPAVAALAAFIPHLTPIVFGAKWLPAVPLVYFVLFPTLWATVTWPLIAGLNALGRPDIVWRLMVMWLVLEWSLSTVLVLRLGYIGFAIANGCVSFSFIVTVIVFKRYQPVNVLSNVVMPTLSMVIAGAGAFVLDALRPPTSAVPLVLDCAFVLVEFVLVEAALDRHFIPDVRYVLRAVFSKVRARPAPVEVETLTR